VVALLAAAIFCRTISGVVNASDSGRFDSLANRYEGMWDSRKFRAAMPSIQPTKLDWGWLNE